MEQNERTKIQEVAGRYMLASDNSYIIEQYKIISEVEGEDTLEKIGVFESKEKVEDILRRIHERPFRFGQDPHNRFTKKYGV